MIQLEPLNGGARRELADTYTQMEDWANASREAVRAADLLPGDIEAQLAAAELLIIGRRFQDARARADRALANFEQEPGSARYHYHLGLACATWATGTAPASTGMSGVPPRWTPQRPSRATFWRTPAFR